MLKNFAMFLNFFVEAGRKLRTGRRYEIVATAVPLRQPSLDVLTPHEVKMKIGEKYNNINWKEQLPDIPSHIGESVYPGIRLDTLAKIVPDSVPNSVSNKLPNTVPNFAPVPIISHNHVPNGIQVTKDEPVDAPRFVGIKQEGVNSIKNPLGVEAIKDAIKNARRRSFNHHFRSKPHVRNRASVRTRESDDKHTRSGVRWAPRSKARTLKGYYKRPIKITKIIRNNGLRSKRGRKDDQYLLKGSHPNYKPSISRSKRVILTKQKRNLAKLINGKNKNAAKRGAPQKGKKAAKRTTIKKKDINLQTKLVHTALKTAELLRAQERSGQAANMVYGNEENIGMQ